MKSLLAHTSRASASLSLTKSQLIEALARKRALTNRQAAAAVSTIFETLVVALRNGVRIEIRGLGSFWVNDYGAYVGRNPRTGADVAVPAKRLVRFRQGKEMAVRVNRGPSG